MSEKFCLRWNEFERNVSGAFQELREDKEFFDVTIACEDDQVEAHKVIISACSPFFRRILSRMKNSHPLLYLKGVRSVDLVSVINFMYYGEVNVAQEELTSFLNVAEDLKVKGLTQKSSQSQSSSKSTSDHSSSKPSLLNKPALATDEYRLPPRNISNGDVQIVLPVKSEPTSEMSELASASNTQGQSHVQAQYQPEQCALALSEDARHADSSVTEFENYAEYMDTYADNQITDYYAEEDSTGKLEI